jgi:hypothetical protein
LSKKCDFGVTTEDTTVLVFGDSHAGHWFAGLQALALKHDFHLVMLTKGGCAALDVVPILRGKPYPSCGVWRKNALEIIGREKPRVVIASSRSAYCEDCASASRGIVEGIREASPDSAVYVFEDAPYPPNGGVPGCLTTHLDNAQACVFNRSDAVNVEERRTLAVGAREAGATWVPTLNWFCASKRCPAIVGNIGIYADEKNHMTDEYARWLSPVVWAVIGKDLAESPDTRP